MVTCKECKFWYSEDDNSHLQGIRADYYYDCLLDGDKFIYDPTIEESKPDSLMYCDSDGYSAHFKTGPDFGCIHGTPKE